MKNVCLLLGLYAWCAAVLLGQGFGTIVGTVTDPSSAVIAGARVTIVEPATGATREETTNDQGYFVATPLKPSTYDLTVNAPGFGAFTRKGVVLQADQNLTVNTTLTLGAAAETISVTGEMPQVNTTTATLSEVVEQRRVVDPPLNGRNAASLLLVVVGAIPAPGSDVDQGNTKTFPATVTVSTNGTRQNQVSFRLGEPPSDQADGFSDHACVDDRYITIRRPVPGPL